MPQERYPAKAFAQLLEDAAKQPGRKRSGKRGLRVSAQQAKSLGIAVASARTPAAPVWKADEAFDPQERLAQALRDALGEAAVKTEVQGLIPGRKYRADIVIEQSKLIIEFDGFRYHRSKAAFQKDRERQNAFTQAGWKTLRFFHAQVRNTLDTVVRQVLEVVGEDVAAPPP